ncbi:MAG: hypothetical protein R2911_33145 [Caldilineaceae bacterium]
MPIGMPQCGAAVCKYVQMALRIPLMVGQQAGWCRSAITQLLKMVVIASGNQLAGSGLVSMKGGETGNQMTPLFQDSFDIATDSGILRPKPSWV